MAEKLSLNQQAKKDDLIKFIKECTASPNSYTHYTEFKRINECLCDVLNLQNIFLPPFLYNIIFYYFMCHSLIYKKEVYY